MIESDPIGATWGPGVRRAPLVTSWGWTKDVVAAMKTPTLMITGAHDVQVAPRVCAISTRTWVRPRKS